MSSGYERYINKVIIIIIIIIIIIRLKSKCYQKSNIFKISWQQLKNQFGP